MVHYQNLYNNYHQKLGKFNRNFDRKMMKLSKRAKSKLMYFVCLFFLSCSLVWVFQIPGFPSSMPCIFLYETSGGDEFLHEKVNHQRVEMGSKSEISSSISNNGTIMQCNRSHFRTDICLMKGDIRTHSSSSSIFLYTPAAALGKVENRHEELIRPYTRKWETNLMKTVDELHLISTPKPVNDHLNYHECDVVHDVPAIFFSTGGYTGNVYHEFNDGIIPLYITSRHYNKNVVFLILDYHNWWYTKYSRVLFQLSNYPPIDFKSDSRTHCFEEAVVGLDIHDELTIDSSSSSSNNNPADFRALLGEAFDDPHPLSITIIPNRPRKKPKAVILSRRGSRSITNENSLVKLAQKLGFDVKILNPKPNTDLGSIYKAISRSDVMIGVHGAAMTHFLFLRPGSMVIQVVPLGTGWAAETYYGQPVKKFGLKYVEYKVEAKESSLYYKYGETDPVLMDPDSVNKNGWEYTKKIYLDDQYLTLDLKRFARILSHAYDEYILRS